MIPLFISCLVVLRSQRQRIVPHWLIHLAPFSVHSHRCVWGLGLAQTCSWHSTQEPRRFTKPRLVSAQPDGTCFIPPSMYIIGISLGSFWMLCSLRLDSIYGRFQSIQNPALLSSLLEAPRSRDTVTLLVLSHSSVQKPRFLTEALRRLNVIWH